VVGNLGREKNVRGGGIALIKSGCWWGKNVHVGFPFKKERGGVKKQRLEKDAETSCTITSSLGPPEQQGGGHGKGPVMMLGGQRSLESKGGKKEYHGEGGLAG